MGSQPGKQIIAIQILPNMSRSKRIQTIKFVQLVKYNMKKIFLYPFLKIIYEHMSGSMV